MKTAVVTGASTGIGRAIAIELGKKGWLVYAVARRQPLLEETKKLVENAGGKAEVVVCDLRETYQVNRIAQRVATLDLLVNIAGIWHGDGEVYAGKYFGNFDQKVILDTYAVGFTAPTLLVHSLLPKLHAGSMIINLSGTFESGAKGWLPYYASKRALEDFSRGLAEELADKGIRVNCLSPSDTATEEYKKYFPEDAKDANSPEAIAAFALKIIEGADSGKFWILRRGSIIEDGFHK